MRDSDRSNSRGQALTAAPGRIASFRASFPWAIAASAGLIALASVAVYSNSLHCPFIYDDYTDIVNNASIHSLRPIWDVFLVPNNGRMAPHGRPVVILSLALNYAVGGLNPFLYHLVNLAIHVLAGLTLFGIVRRTLLLPCLGRRFVKPATPVALATALIWSLHPLNTAAVTCVVQRYESMMGLFYFLALYAGIRCGTSPHPRRWAIATAAAALFSMGCKEVAVSIPIIILLYDRAFLAGSFREALRRRSGMYVGLAAAWATFAVFFAFSGGRGSWAGYRLPVSWMEYARSQFGVILHYLRLSFWPRPLVLDYDWPVAQSVGDILPGALVIGGLAAVTVCALIRWPKWGFLGAWFFLILAPTSSVMPLADLAFEHRMYLPLAAVVASVVIGIWLAGQWLVDRRMISASVLPIAGGALALLAGAALAVLTVQRNADYRDDVTIWQDTVVKAPGNVRAHYNIGLLLADRKQYDEAIAAYERSLKSFPNNADAHNNLGLALVACNRLDEAIVHYRRALELKHDHAGAYNNLGIALVKCDKVDEAITQYEKALEFAPDSPGTENNLAIALERRGRLDDAIAHYQKALALKPEVAICATTHNNLANVLVGKGRFDEAIAHHKKALELRPDYAEAYNGLGTTLAECGRVDEAVAYFRKALQLKPDYAEARQNLAVALGQLKSPQ